MLLQFALPADHAGHRILAIQQRHREYEAAFAQQHPPRMVGHRDGAAGKVGDLPGLCAGQGAKERGGGHGRAEENY
ncbi:hypothetical protein D3C72_2129680 [compost metagenome]